jgi:hypothetical protein
MKRLKYQRLGAGQEAGLRRARGVITTVKLIDVSAGGFQCACAELIPIGTTVSLVLRARTMFRATVIWQNSERLGAAFKTSITEESVRRKLQQLEILLPRQSS